MIKNDRQYQLARSNLKKFQETLDRYDKLTKGEPAWARKLHKTTIAAEVKTLQAELADYEALRFGNTPMPQLGIIQDIPNLLIKRRIALGWTQEDLAKRLGVQPQQVQNDEATDYSSASFARLAKIAQILQESKRQGYSHSIVREQAASYVAKSTTRKKSVNN